MTVVQHFVRQPMYRTQSNARLQLLLGAINDRLHTAMQEQVQITGALTVEHIMPQSPNDENWPIPDKYADDAEAQADYRQRRDGFIHSIGNLTLVTQALNSSLSNSSFDVKRAAVLQHSTLLLNHQIAACNDWTEERIAERGRSLANLATAIWPRPGL